MNLNSYLKQIKNLTSANLQVSLFVKWSHPQQLA